MIKKEFQSNRPIFFISDSKVFDFVEFSYDGVSNEDIISNSNTTISLACADATEDKYAILEIYIHEDFAPNRNTMINIFEGKLELPSGKIEISEGDAEIVFEENFPSGFSYVNIYIESGYYDLPEKFFIVLK